MCPLDKASPIVRMHAKEWVGQKEMQNGAREQEDIGKTYRLMLNNELGSIPNSAIWYFAFSSIVR